MKLKLIESLTTYLFYKLFKYSLAGEASRWLKQLPPRSLTSWADIKNVFLRNFFHESQAEDLRRNIATFTQDPTKSFKILWIIFKSYQRECPQLVFNEVQLLNTFFSGITLAYQMALDTASDRYFTTRNPEKAVRLIENLASSNSTKNTDFERRKSATLEKEELDNVKLKLDSVQKVLKEQVSFAEDMEAVKINSDGDLEEEVHLISTGFQNQKHENQSGYRNSYGNEQRSNFNQNSQFQKPYSNNFNNSNNMNYGNSSYQNVPPHTRESKIEAIIDQVL